MPHFELVSDYQPMGDQPQAIEKLVQGLDNNLKHQTLLGATATGKSLGFDDPVFVSHKQGQALSSQVISIGKLIDDLMQSPGAKLRYEGDTEILDVDGDYYAQAFDPQTCTVALYPIGSFVRHDSPAVMYRLQTACGRSATLTGDHNLWVLREGCLQLICTSDAKTTDYLPVPDRLLTEEDTAALNVLPILAGKRLFVDASEAILDYAQAYGVGETQKAMIRSEIGTPYSKLSAMRHGKRGRGIEVSKFQQLLEDTHNLEGKWEPAKASVGGKVGHNRLPVELELTPELLSFLGYYLAEGNCQRGYIIIANQDTGIRDQIQKFLAQKGLPF